MKILAILIILNSCKCEKKSDESKTTTTESSPVLSKKDSFLLSLEYTKLYGNPIKYKEYNAIEGYNYFTSPVLDNRYGDSINDSIHIIEIKWKINEDSLMTVWYEKNKVKNIFLDSLIYSKYQVF